jgi:hypothetical protein
LIEYKTKFYAYASGQIISIFFDKIPKSEKIAESLITFEKKKLSFDGRKLSV